MDAILADYADEIYSEGNHKINKKLSLLVRKHFLWMKDPLLIPDFRTPEEQEEDSSNRNWYESLHNVTIARCSVVFQSHLFNAYQSQVFGKNGGTIPWVGFGVTIRRRRNNLLITIISVRLYIPVRRRMFEKLKFKTDTFNLRTVRFFSISHLRSISVGCVPEFAW